MVLNVDYGLPEKFLEQGFIDLILDPQFERPRDGYRQSRVKNFRGSTK